ncbi:MAG: nitroreductase family protein [Halobacteriota archaeon]
MNVIDALNSRFTVRAFEPDPVHKGTILKILDAATRAPSSGNTQPWELFVAGGDALDRLRRAFEERFRKGCRAAPIYRHRNDGPPRYKSVWTNSRPHALHRWA